MPQIKKMKILREHSTSEVVIHCRLSGNTLSSVSWSVSEEVYIFYIVELFTLNRKEHQNSLFKTHVSAL